VSNNRRRLDLTDLPNQVDVIAAKIKLLSSEGWSEDRLIAYALDALHTHWFNLSKPGANEIDDILANAGYRRDWHRLWLLHLQGFAAYRKPEPNPSMPMPPGTEDAAMARWIEREQGWNRELKLAELTMEKYSIEYSIHVR
jgi:hypothetical protein